MTCTHTNELKCIVCHPELWHPPQEEIDAINRKIYQIIVENLVKWNKAYREGEALVSDYKYDSRETSLKDAYPNHPLLKMVGHNDEEAVIALAYIPDTKENPILRAPK